MFAKQQYSVFNVENQLPNALQQTIVFREYFRHNFDQHLAKAIGVPLMYGKANVDADSSLASDLATFFSKGCLYPDRSFLIKLARQIIDLVKTDLTFRKVNHFISMLRSVANLLFDSNLLTIRGPYCDFVINYHQEEISLQRLDPFESKPISIHRVIKSNEAQPRKSKTKAIDTFAQNYIHFLEGVVCNYVIKKQQLDKKNNFALGIIDNGFFIKPKLPKKKENTLHQLYKEGLVMAFLTHEYNLLHWLYDLIKSMQVKDNQKNLRLEPVRIALIGFEQFQKTEHIDLEKSIDWNYLIMIIDLFQDHVTPLQNKTYWNDIVQYLKVCKSMHSNHIIKQMLSDHTDSLFAKNSY